MVGWPVWTHAAVCNKLCQKTHLWKLCRAVATGDDATAGMLTANQQTFCVRLCKKEKQKSFRKRNKVYLDSKWCISGATLPEPSHIIAPGMEQQRPAEKWAFKLPQTKTVFSSSVRFLFFAGVEGSGHHLWQTAVCAAPHTPLYAIASMG